MKALYMPAYEGETVDMHFFFVQPLLMFGFFVAYCLAYKEGVGYQWHGHFDSFFGFFVHLDYDRSLRSLQLQ